MVKVHGQKNKKEKKENSPESEKEQAPATLISEDDIKIRMAIYDVLLESSHLEGLGLPGDVFDYICEEITLKILEAIKKSGFNIVNSKNDEQQKNEVLNLIKELESQKIDPEEVLQNDASVKREYIVSVINQLISDLEPINEIEFNCFIPFKNNKWEKLKEEEPSIVTAYNEDTNQTGISTFSLISTITNILLGKKIRFDSDDDNDYILKAGWGNDKKSEIIEQRLEEAINNWKNAPSNKKAQSIDQLIKIAKIGIMTLKEHEE